MIHKVTIIALTITISSIRAGSLSLMVDLPGYDTKAEFSSEENRDEELNQIEEFKHLETY